jgi:DNA-directed RNA polymerase specialized sigma24 family protein
VNEDSELDPQWARVAALQNRLRNRTTIDHTAFAIEEQLDQFLASIADESLPPVDDQESWLTNLETNRRRKYRHRSKLLEKHAIELRISASFRTQLDHAIQNEQLLLIQGLTSRAEFSILVRLALGEEYSTIAQHENVTVGALKTAISRCRRRLREHLTA